MHWWGRYGTSSPSHWTAKTKSASPWMSQGRLWVSTWTALATSYKYQDVDAQYLSHSRAMIQMLHSGMVYKTLVHLLDTIPAAHGIYYLIIIFKAFRLSSVPLLHRTSNCMGWATPCFEMGSSRLRESIFQQSQTLNSWAWLTWHIVPNLPQINRNEWSFSVK
jgi:hypothetical protein